MSIWSYKICNTLLCLGTIENVKQEHLAYGYQRSFAISSFSFQKAIREQYKPTYLYRMNHITKLNQCDLHANSGYLAATK